MLAIASANQFLLGFGPKSILLRHSRCNLGFFFFFFFEKRKERKIVAFDPLEFGEEENLLVNCSLKSLFVPDSSNIGQFMSDKLRCPKCLKFTANRKSSTRCL